MPPIPEQEAPPAPKSATRRRLRALGYLALAAALAIAYLARPVAVGLLLGVLLAFSLQPLYGRLRGRHWKEGPAALVCTLGATAVIWFAVVGMGVLFVTRGVALVGALPAKFAPGGDFHSLALRLPDRLGAFGLDSSKLLATLREEAVNFGERAAAYASVVAGATFSGLLMLLFLALATYFVLVHWRTIVARAEVVLPFERRHTHALLDQFRSVGRQVLRGTVLTGLAQGALAALGYWITGVDDPLFFGVLTAAASLVPAVGTLMVWVPLGVYRIATGHVAAGIGELVYSTLMVGIVSDYVIRPRLVGGEESTPAVLTFVALFGGVEVFGLIGLILGPILMTLSLAVIRTYYEELTHAAEEPG